MPMRFTAANARSENPHAQPQACWNRFWRRYQIPFVLSIAGVVAAAVVLLTCCCFCCAEAPPRESIYGHEVGTFTAIACMQPPLIKLGRCRSLCQFLYEQKNSLFTPPHTHTCRMASSTLATRPATASGRGLVPTFHSPPHTHAPTHPHTYRMASSSLLTRPATTSGRRRRCLMPTRRRQTRRPRCFIDPRAWVAAAAAACAALCHVDSTCDIAVDLFSCTVASCAVPFALAPLLVPAQKCAVTHQRSAPTLHYDCHPCPRLFLEARLL